MCFLSPNPPFNYTVNRSSQRGQSAAPILVFLGIVTLSVIFFFVFTLPQCTGRQPAVTTLPQTAPVVPPKPVVPEPVVAPQPPPPTVVTPPKPFYMKSSQFLAALAERLNTGKLEEAMELMAPTVPQAKKEFFQKLFTTAGYKPASGENPWQEIGRISGQERWLLPLTKSSVVQNTPPQIPTTPAPASTNIATTTPAAPTAADSPLTNPSGISLTVGDPPPPPATDSAPPTPDPTPSATTPAAAATAASKAPELSIDLKLSREEGYQITGLRFSPELLQAQGSAMDRSLADSPDPLSISHDFVTEVLG